MGANERQEEGPADLDLHDRLSGVPETARARGIFFRVLQDEMARRGLLDALGWEWEQILGEYPRSYGLYPVRHLMVAYAEAARVVAPDRREGLRDIFRGSSSAYSESWFGRGLKRFLAPDPLAALRWIERSRDHVCDYGHWRVEAEGIGRATVHMVDEYVWIDSAHRGGCEGLLTACGVSGEVTAELDGPYRGRLRVRQGSCSSSHVFWD